MFKEASAFCILAKVMVPVAFVFTQYVVATETSLSSNLPEIGVAVTAALLTVVGVRFGQRNKFDPNLP